MIVLFYLCFVSLCSFSSAQSPTKPLSKDDVVELLRGSVSSRRVAEIARQRGIDFQLTAETERELREAKARDKWRFTLRELAPTPAAQTATQPALAIADQLLAAGKVPEASAKYHAIVQADPNSVGAQVGLIRSYMMMQKLDEAQAAIDTALAQQPNSWLLLLTLGDLRYAQGKIPEAERAYLKAQTLKPDEAAPYLGLARVYRVYSL